MAARKKRGKVGGMRPGSGRRPKGRDEKHGRPVMLYLTEGEYAALREAAVEEPVATLARRLVVRALRRRGRA